MKSHTDVEARVQNVSFLRRKVVLLYRNHCWTLAAALWVMCLWLAPWAALTLLIVNFLFALLLAAGQLVAARLPAHGVERRRTTEEPFVSVHVPIHDEPPNVVRQTLSSLTNLDYRNYEVIVLDNNTADPARWRPVEAFCDEFGSPFRFRHVDNVTGFKAGALDICLELMHPETKYVLVLDADYCVDSSLLKTALGHFTSPDVALVQFPQAYSNVSERNGGLRDEYAHFFDVYMNMANRLGSVLSTGTVSVIRADALREVGGWHGASITEDVELGLKLLGAGYRGVYLNLPLGRGLMPTDLGALKKQRRRWVFGNAQTLLHFLRMDKRALGTRQKLGVLTLLTAWFNFTLLPLASLLPAGLLYALEPQPVRGALLALSLLTLWTYWLVKLTFFWLWRGGASPGRTLVAYFSHLGLAWEGAYAWVACLLGRPLGFERTDKFLFANRTKGGVDLVFPGTLVLLGLVLWLEGTEASALLLFATALVPLGGLVLREQVRQTYLVSVPLYQALERRWGDKQ